MPEGPLLLDTNVFSFLAYRKGPHVEFARLVVGHQLWISWVTVGEVLAGALKGGWSDEDMGRVDTRLRSYGIIPGDIEVARAYGALKASLGTSVQFNDLWIAASALGQTPALPVVTFDKDFARIAAVSGLIIVAP